MNNPYKIGERVQYVDPAKLESHPRNAEVHGDFDPRGRDAWLAQDVAENGVLFPVLLRPDGTIEDGHRRVKAAVRAGIKQIPHIILEAGDDRAFMSAQLARELSMHAKCVLYRDKIDALVTEGNKRKARNLPKPPQNCTGAVLADDEYEEEPKDEHEEAWIVLEQVLGKNRYRLSQGVALLALVDEGRRSGKPKIMRRADMIASIFRNKGLKPALRLADQSDETGDDGEDDAPGKEGEWPALEKRKAKKRKRKAAPDLTLQEAVVTGDIEPAHTITDADRWAMVVWRAHFSNGTGWLIDLGQADTLTEAVDAEIVAAREVPNG